MATIKASEYAIYARTVEIALGNTSHVGVPTRVLTDNLGNMRVAGKDNSAARSRYFLIRYTILKYRIAEGHLVVKHVADENNPSDFLTKSSIPREKFDTSLSYASGMAA